MLKLKSIIIYTLFFPFFCFAALECPPADIVKSAHLSITIPVPNPILTIKDHIVIGHINHNDTSWYIFDGLFANLIDPKEILEKGNALLENAREPSGPYHDPYKNNYCLYYHKVFDSSDYRPKFIITIRGKVKEPQEILDIVKKHGAY